MVKDIICLIQGRNLFHSNKYLFGPKIVCLNQTNFISLKQKFFLYVFQTNKFFDSIKYFS